MTKVQNNTALPLVLAMKNIPQKAARKYNNPKPDGFLRINSLYNIL
jgi:hypothetical protein